MIKDETLQDTAAPANLIDLKEQQGPGARESEVHFWRPPCSCGIDLETVVAESVVHYWRPPCSCGIGLEDVILDAQDTAS